LEYFFDILIRGFSFLYFNFFLHKPPAQKMSNLLNAIYLLSDNTFSIYLTTGFPQKLWNS